MAVSFSSVVLGLSASYALYILIGYPFLLSTLAGLRRQPVRRGSYFPSVSLILATHNGAPFLRDKLDSIFALDHPRSLVSVIVVDDGSTDETAAILAAYKHPLTMVHTARQGKSAALTEGIARAGSSEILVFTDVRQALASDSLRLLLENFADPRVGAASAELQIRAAQSHEEANTGAYWRYERWIRQNLSAIDSIFGATGSYYAIRRELVPSIPPGILNDDMYLPLPAFFRGYRLVVDARAKMYDYPTGLSTEFGRKVRTLAGNYQIIRHFPSLLTFQNRLLFHYLSYKLGRLLLPFALLAGVIASLFVGGTVTSFSILVQAIIYGLALADPIIPAKSRVKRLSSPIRTFLAMMAATACATSIWFLPPGRLWRPTRVSNRNASR